MKHIRALAFSLFGFMLLTGAAFAQSPASSLNKSVAIATGNTFQVVIAASERRSITIQNNNTNGDNCFVEISGLVQSGDTTSTTYSSHSGMTAAGVSILLGQGQAYTRYYPYIPREQIVATCASNGDTVYADFQ